VKASLQRAWESPTLMTWGMFAVRASSFVVVLPLVLTRLSPAEVVVWFLLATLLSTQWLMDLGFGSTMSRVVAYALAGATDAKGFREARTETQVRPPNWDLMARVVGSLRRIYFMLALASVAIIALVGSIALAAPVSRVAEPMHAWAAWLVVLALYPLGLWSNLYSSYLEGTNRVALVRRWDIFFGLGGIASSLLVLLLGGKLLALVIASQAWVLARIPRHPARCLPPAERRFPGFPRTPPDRALIAELWPAAWRAAVGSVMSYGVIYASNLLVGQSRDTALAASYLLSMRVIEMVDQFAMAPFYSRLPVLARLRAQNLLEELSASARLGMLRAYWTFVAGFLAFAFFAEPLLHLAGSHTAFVPPALWTILGLAYFLHRYGAMHVQLYSTTNHITSHVADSVSGAIFAVLALLLFPRIGIHAVPVALLAAYLCFYSWYTPMLSYRSIGTSFLRFERAVLLPPLALMLAYAAFVFAGGR